MKILILTGQFGMGHLQCANTLKHKIERENPQVEVTVLDFLAYLQPHIYELWYQIYDFLISRCFGIYNFFNKFYGEIGESKSQLIYKDKVQALLSAERPDLVISNMPVCSQIFNAYRTYSGCEIPLYVYVTDVTFRGEWISKNTERYYVADESTKAAFAAAGVAEDIIFVSGIPVSDDFTPRPEDGPRRSVLLMGGGAGLIPGGKKTVDLFDQMGIDVFLVCGNNKKLHAYAEKNCKNIKVFGLTDRVPELMRAAKLVVTKPGGITTFEAIRAETPLCVMEPVLAQEAGNLKLIIDKQIGYVLHGEDEICADTFKRLLGDEEKLNAMRENMRAIKRAQVSCDPLAQTDILGEIKS